MGGSLASTAMIATALSLMLLGVRRVQDVLPSTIRVAPSRLNL
jgi:hypothetical protein